MKILLIDRKIFLMTVTFLTIVVGFPLLVIGGSPFLVERSINFSQNDLSFDKIQEYDIIYLQERNYLNQPGKPMLPMKMVKIALPEGMSVEELRIVSEEYQELSGEFNIFPSQPPVEITETDADPVFISPDEGIYNSLQPYPINAAKLIRQSDLAGQAIADVTIYPLQYIPGEKKVRLLTRIRFVLEGSGGYECGDYLPANISEKNRASYIQRLNKMVANQEDVVLTEAPSTLKLSSSLPSATPFEHVIITSSNNAPYYQPLVDWHYKRGLCDTIITTDYIYSIYAGTDEKERIRNFIIDAHQNWGTMYILLGGELTTIPFAYRNYDNTSVPSDAYYADYDDDWEYEVYLGRMTAEGAVEVNRFVNKVLKYETDPPILNFSLNAALLGMDLTTANDPPYYTLTRGEYMKELIDDEHVPPRFNVTEIYDSDIRNHRDDFIAALNTGQNLVNHCDHANYSVICTGDRNHNWCFYTGDVYNLTNYNKYSNIYSLGCYANRMDVNDAISEHFIFGTDSTGAVSFTGNTRSGWFYVGDPLSLSSDLDIKWWAAVLDFNWHKLGEALAFCKSMSSVESQHPFSEWTLNLLGEPAMPIWLDMPTSMNVMHQTDIEALPQEFTVQVEKFGGIGIEYAYVCLWLNGDIYERGSTDADGNITFDIAPTTVGSMYVTVTKQNYIPYQGQATVSGNIPPTCHVPNDTVIFQCVPTAVSLSVGCSDDDGNLESGPELVRGLGEIVGSNWEYTPSIDEDSVEVTIRCTDSLGYFCETTFIVYFDFNDIPVCQVPDDTTITHVAPATEISLPVFADDPDDNIYEGLVVSGPGSLSEGYWNYTPTNDEIIDVSVRFNDECGAFSENSFRVTYNIHACGDPNTDLEVNIFDVSYLISYLYLGGPAPDPMLTGDPNADKAINIFDVTYLIGFLYSGGSIPYCP